MTEAQQAQVGMPPVLKLVFWFVGIAIALLIVTTIVGMVAGGDEDNGPRTGVPTSSPKQATRAVASDLSLAISGTKGCFEAADAACTNAQLRAYAICLAVNSDGAILTGDDRAKFQGADWQRFEPICDGYEVAMEMPKIFALPEFTRLSIEARRAAD